MGILDSTNFHIFNQDCGEVLPTLESFSISTIISDPPYAVNFRSANTTYNDSKDFIISQIPQWMSEWYRILKPESWMFLFTGVKNINVWIDEAERAGFSFKNMLATRAFCRGGATAKNFVFEMQPILCFTKGEVGRKFNNVDFFPASKEWLNDKRNKNKTPYSYSYSNWIPSSICYGTATFGSDSVSNQRHPNEKNEDLIRFLVQIATEQGETVLDPFSGSGTTGAAAVSVGRKYIGIEMDEHWYNVSTARVSGAGDWKKIPIADTKCYKYTQGELF